MHGGKKAGFGYQECAGDTLTGKDERASEQIIGVNQGVK